MNKVEHNIKLNTSKKLAKQISNLMLEKKALDIQIIDVGEITTLTDFFIICTSESEPQTKAITDHINENMKSIGFNSWHTEGYQNKDWVLIDFVNIVVHIFSKNARSFYEFERLSADGNIEYIKDK